MAGRPIRTRRWLALGAALAVALGAGGAEARQAKREFTITAYKYGYRVSGTNRPEIRVTEGELIKITFQAEDIPHSFTLDEFRIMRRAEPGKPITIEFRADKPGQFPFYCNLPIDERCQKETRGVLRVDRK
jgi:heme/copper-type cytochrome/quinol oxidase subunit 2